MQEPPVSDVPSYPRPPEPPLQPPPRPRRPLWGLTVLFGCLVVVLAGALAVCLGIIAWLTPRGEGLATAGKPAVALVSVEGLITASDFGGFMAPAAGMVAVLDQLRRAEKDDSVKAVVLWVDSPGGAPAAAQAVYNRVRELKSKKPVVAAMGDTAASGAYYISSAATKIVASPGTLTGSIGVIFSSINFAELLKRYGVEDVAITSGPYKDLLSPFRAPRPDEKALVKQMVMDIYDQFVRDVAAGRGMDVQRVRKLADGRVYTGRQARALGLVDQLGSRDDAILLAAQLGGIEGWPRIKEYISPPAWLRWLGETGAIRRPWYLALVDYPGPWLTLPPPGAGALVFPAMSF
ncbi:MAG: signal peptide peptidase SppA [Armatimonadetes bacterium]|nr:signal peptide peptidase SppA [Armatimonadota bacterium]